MGDEDREARILNAAERLFLHYGFDKTTVSEIASEAGISKGAIYLHYTSKDELFEALIWRVVWTYSDEMIRRLEEDTEAWSFVMMYRHAMSVIAEQPLMQAIMRGDERVMGSFLRRHGEKFMALKRPFQLELFQKMQELNVIRQDLDVKVIAYLFSTFSTGFVYMPTMDIGMEAPPMDEVMMSFGDMIDRFLTPENGGDQEAGRQLILEMVEAFKQQQVYLKAQQAAGES